VKTHPRPPTCGPAPAAASRGHPGYGADEPGGAETPGTANATVSAAPCPIPGSDGPQPDLDDPDRSAPALGRRRGEAADSTVEEDLRHRTAAPSEPVRPAQLLHPRGSATTWWELMVLVAGGGVGAGLGYRVGRSRLRTPRERAGCAP
jgi:hypothetical protein